MKTCANVASKNVEANFCNTRYKHILHVGEFLRSSGKPQ